MKSVNKTRYAILGVLLESPSTGYEIKSLMGRSTAYFWRESDSTIYPMLKVLAKEGKVQSEIAYVGKKKKEIFRITKEGRKEFKEWLLLPTGSDTPRNEFLLKFFFLTDEEDTLPLLQERLEKLQKILEEFKEIENRINSLPEFPRKKIRLRALQLGMAHTQLEINWLKEGIE